MKLIPFPQDFANKGRFHAWTPSWEPAGYRDSPQYPGQMPIVYPEDAAPVECFFGGYLRP